MEQNVEEVQQIKSIYEEMATTANKRRKKDANYFKNNITIKRAATDVKDAIFYSSIKGDGYYITLLLRIPSVAKIVGEWRDSKGNNILHFLCAKNDFRLAGLVLAQSGDALLTEPNLEQQLPYLLINGVYKPFDGLDMLRWLKERGTVDLNPIKNALIDDIQVKAYYSHKYHKYFKVEALKLFQEFNMITEEDATKLNEIVADGIRLWYGPNALGGHVADCYIAALGKRAYKYDTTLWDLFSDTILHIVIATLPKFIWCLLDRNLSAKEALVVLQYCTKLCQRPHLDNKCLTNVMGSLLVPCLVKFPEEFSLVMKDLPPLCYYTLIERFNVLSYDISENILKQILEYADRPVTQLFSIEDLPNELIAIIIGYTPPRITQMFAILNKRLSGVYSSHRKAIWQQKYRTEMPFISAPDLTGKKFRRDAARRRYTDLSGRRRWHTDLSGNLWLGGGNLTFLETSHNYLLAATDDKNFHVWEYDLWSKMRFPVDETHFRVRLCEDRVYCRTNTECHIYPLTSGTQKTFPLKASTAEDLAFTVDNEWLMTSDGLHDLRLGGRVAYYRKTSERFDACIFRAGLCYEQTAGQIQMRDPRFNMRQVGSCEFESKRSNRVKFNMKGHSLIVASDKIDIFDIRDLTRPVASSPNLESGVKLLDLHSMKAFTTQAVWNLQDMTYMLQARPYRFNWSAIAVTNGKHVFSHYRRTWGGSVVDFATALDGAFAQSDYASYY